MTILASSWEIFGWATHWLAIWWTQLERSWARGAVWVWTAVAAAARGVADRAYSFWTFVGSAWAELIAYSTIEQGSVAIAYIEAISTNIGGTLIAAVTADVGYWDSGWCWGYISIFFTYSVGDGTCEVWDVACAKIDGELSGVSNGNRTWSLDGSVPVNCYTTWNRRAI